MPLIKCPECSKEISSLAQHCVHCGSPILQTSDVQKKKPNAELSWSQVAGFAAITAAVVAYAAYKRYAPEKSNPQATTETRASLVYNSEWDGSVHQIRSFLKKSLKDPKSLDVIEWGQVVEASSADPYPFYARVKYRSKNSFGGFVIAHQVFYLSDSGSVEKVVDWSAE